MHINGWLSKEKLQAADNTDVDRSRGLWMGVVGRAELMEKRDICRLQVEKNLSASLASTLSTVKVSCLLCLISFVC